MHVKGYSGKEKKARRRIMNKNSTTVSELRFQDYENGDVHIHDDSHNLKFVANQDDFKEQMEIALEDLKTTDGIIKIEGTSKEVLYLLKEGRSFHVFVAGGKSKKKELEKFVDGL